MKTGLAKASQAFSPVLTSHKYSAPLTTTALVAPDEGAHKILVH